MENLVNLCHLDLSGANRLESMPPNFSMLTNLQTLSLFVLGKGKGSQIRELQDLSNLRGQLCISGLQNIVEPLDARMAKLCDKSGLKKLELLWKKDHENRRQEVDEKVLEGLQPSKKLKELGIKFYSGAMLAKWVGGSSLNDLQSLCLDGCPNLSSLPPIGRLPFLKKVCIEGLESVTSVGVEFFGENTGSAFSSLEFLEFSNMRKWEKWNLYEVDEEARKFPRLRELRIKKCPSFLGSIPECLPSLEKLTVDGCEKLIVSIQSFPKLLELEIKGCHEVVYKGFAEDSSLKRVCFSRISRFTSSIECLMSRSVKVESFEIGDYEELCTFRENKWGCLTQSMSVGDLRIGGCGHIVSIGAEEEREDLKIPYNTKSMQIWGFSRLEKLSTTLHCLTSLRKIELYDCPKLISISRSNLPLNLNGLYIYSCDNLESLMLDEGENVNSSSNTCVLQQMVISDCSSLKRINRSELPTSLKQLTIERCPQLESIAQEIQDDCSLVSINIRWCDKIKELPRGMNKLKHLQSMTIYCCSNLISFPESGLPTTNLKKLLLGDCQRLQALPGNIHNLNSLEELEIRDCPNVTSFPEGGIPNPTNLTDLKIGGANICKAIMEWGLHTLISLESLTIDIFTELEILSSDDFRNLTSLRCLEIKHCPNLKSLPEKNMLSSLLELYIYKCPMLEEGCKRDEGLEWHKLAHIPRVDFSPRYDLLMASKEMKRRIERLLYG